MKKELMFEKELSALKGLQSKSTVSYYLLENEHGFGIEVSEDAEGECQSDYLNLAFKERIEAEKIITYLFENSIYLANYKEIIDDILALNGECYVSYQTSDCRGQS